MRRKPPLQPPRKFDDEEPGSYEVPPDSPMSFDARITALQTQQDQQLRLLQEFLENRNHETSQIRELVDRSVERKLAGFREETMNRCRILAAEVAREESNALLGHYTSPQQPRMEESQGNGPRFLLGLLAVGLAAAGVAAIKSIGSDPGFPGLEQYSQQ